MELLGGTRTEKDFRELKELLDGLPRVDPREPDWSLAAGMAFQLRRAGRTVPFPDVLIAQQAQRADAGIVHADSDFDVLCRHFHIEQEDFTGALDTGGNGSGGR